jgi:hypothetical protein
VLLMPTCLQLCVLLLVLLPLVSRQVLLLVLLQLLALLRLACAWLLLCPAGT